MLPRLIRQNVEAPQPRWMLRRLAIAVALAVDAAVLLPDEIFARHSGCRLRADRLHGLKWTFGLRAACR